MQCLQVSTLWTLSTYTVAAWMMCLPDNYVENDGFFFQQIR